MTPQQSADAWLAAWQLLRHLPPLVRMALIETLCEIERARLDGGATTCHMCKSPGM